MVPEVGEVLEVGVFPEVGEVSQTEVVLRCGRFLRPKRPKKRNTKSTHRLTIRPAQIFLENWDKLHGEVWAKACLETNFQPIRMSFDHPSEASKLPIFKAF